MKHQEIRYRILLLLYYKHYSNQLGHPQVTDNVIREAGLEYVDKNFVYGDIVYLVESSLVKAKMEMLGKPYPGALIISAKGINVAEHMVEDFIKFLDEKGDKESKSQAETLKTIGPSTAQLNEIKGMIDHNSKLFQEFIGKVVSTNITYKYI